MNLRRFAVVFALVAFFCLVAAAAQPGFTQPGRLVAEKIAEGVWFLPGDASKGYCNNIVIEMRDYLIVVDANYPGRARELVSEISQLSPKPVRFVFDTHAHRDHAYGNIVWTEAGATTFAYQGVADEMDRYEPKRWRDTATERDDVRSLNLADAPRPQLLFRQSPFILKDATREVRF
jgi:cyclase